MKKFRSILIISAVAVLCAACETGIVDNAILSWDYQEPEHWIRTSASKLEFLFSGGEEQLSVQLSHSQLWTVDISDCPWVTLTPTSGTGSTDITVTVPAYNRSGVRSGNMVFSFREKKATVAVSQTGFAYLATNPSVEQLEFPSEGGTGSLWLESNQDWTATASDSWIVLHPSFGSGNDSVWVETNANTTTETRSGTVTFKSDDCETTLTVVQEGVQLFIDGHAYVNLGLPSGLLWATMNVGASAPEESGGYYAWGETEEKDNYTWETLKYCARGDDNSNVMFSKYVTLYSRGPVDHRTILESSDDAAASNWGGRWLTPTHDDWTELKEKCSWALSSGYKGYIVTGPNGRSIFLPMAGYFYGTNLYSAGTAGFYWSSTLDVNHPWCAMEIEMWNSQTIKQENGTRYCGRSIRPVLQPSSYFSVSTQSLDFPSAGGTREITLTSNLRWIVQTGNVAWLTVSALSGKGDATLTITADENTSTAPRTATLTIEAGSSTYQITVTQAAAEQQQYDEIDGHYYVDLGLPSGLLWATMNVGASSPEDYGDYFAWGETSAKSEYSWSSYQWSNGTESKLTKYNYDSSYGKVDNKTCLESEDDAAYTNWRGSWRIPSLAEWNELTNSNNCTWTRMKQNGVTGYKVTSVKNGNTIFLPIPGFFGGYEIRNKDLVGYYWSSTLGDNLPYRARHLKFDSYSSDVTSDESTDRYIGLPVRPVNQPNAYLELSTENLVFPADGGTESVTLTANQPWTATADVTWLTLSLASGAGNTVLNITAEANTSTDPRTAILSIEAGGNTYQITVTQAAAEPQHDVIDGHAYVDLGLPSGLLWATVNVGASVAEDIGDYFAWGETEPKTNYSWSTYQWCNGSSSSITKYQNDSSLGMVINILEYSDDAAWVNWGGGWRMPTYGEWDELTSTSYCTWTWTTQDGQSGYRVTSRANGKSIFLPAGGFRESTSLTNLNTFGNYWSSTLFAEKRDYGWYTYFNSSSIGRYYINRSNGQSVRPVYQPSPYFMLSAKNVSFTASGGTNENVVLTTNLSWTASPSASWITLSATSGTGNKGIAITADENTSTQSRTGTITFSAGGSTYVVSVTQDAAEKDVTLSVSPSSLFFSSFGGEETLSVTSSSAWTTTISDTWIDLYPTSGTGDATLTVTADENTSTNSRTGSITFEAGDITFQVTVTQGAADQQQGGEINGHAYVDLGLPSGLLWATCNVGTSSPEGYGDYFAWGETDGEKYLSYTDFSDYLRNYKWGIYTEGKVFSLTKYNKDSSKGTVDNRTTLELSDDAARMNWGSSWRMPTINEWKELLNESNCTWTWTSQEGVEGYEIVSKTNGSSIFLPAAREPLATSEEAYGDYWSSSLSTDHSFYACGIDFSSSIISLLTTKEAHHSTSGDTYTYIDGVPRWFPFSVRPVCRP